MVNTLLSEAFLNVNKNAYRPGSLLGQWRLARLQKFLEYVKPPQHANIIDLGGSDAMWDMFDHSFNITLVNLPGNEQQHSNARGYRYIEADATNLQEVFADRSFDVVFSNSVIEHVGDESKQAAFAQEVQRLGKAFWVQTPSDRFPLEPHTGILFYWKLPEWMRTELKKRWRKRVPAWTDMVEGTRVLSRSRMQDLFPDAQIYIEHKLGCEKSYTLYRPFIG